MKESSTVFEGQIALLLYSYVDVYYDIAIKNEKNGFATACSQQSRIITRWMLSFYIFC